MSTRPVALIPSLQYQHNQLYFGIIALEELCFSNFGQDKQ